MQISLIGVSGGGDFPEVQVGGYNLAINEINWGNGIRLIIHIGDAPVHGSEWCGYDDLHNKENPKLYKLIQRCVEKNIKIIGFIIGRDYYTKKCFENFQSEYIKRKGMLYKIFEFKDFIEISSTFKEKVIESIIIASKP